MSEAFATWRSGTVEAFQGIQDQICQGVEALEA